MTASQDAKQMGLKSLKQAAEMIGVTTETLRNWHKDNPQRFKIVLSGCLCYLNEYTDKKGADSETV